MKITIPIYSSHNMEQIIGKAEIEEDFLPSSPEFCFSLGYVAKEFTDGRVSKYKLLEISVIPDKLYIEYLKDQYYE
jgi:hypothetical protein